MASGPTVIRDTELHPAQKALLRSGGGTVLSEGTKTVNAKTPPGTMGVYSLEGGMSAVVGIAGITNESLAAAARELGLTTPVVTNHKDPSQLEALREYAAAVFDQAALMAAGRARVSPVRVEEVPPGGLDVEFEMPAPLVVSAPVVAAATRALGLTTPVVAAPAVRVTFTLPGFGAVPALYHAVQVMPGAVILLHREDCQQIPYGPPGTSDAKFELRVESATDTLHGLAQPTGIRYAFNGWVHTILALVEVYDGEARED